MALNGIDISNWQAGIDVNVAGDAIDFTTFGSWARFLVFARVS